MTARLQQPLLSLLGLCQVGKWEIGLQSRSQRNRSQAEQGTTCTGAGPSEQEGRQPWAMPPELPWRHVAHAHQAGLASFFTPTLSPWDQSMEWGCSWASREGSFPEQEGRCSVSRC